ncbi:MAG: hypothetical protein D6742_19860, partial [Cyanobacteria bacterium J069]
TSKFVTKMKERFSFIEIHFLIKTLHIVTFCHFEEMLKPIGIRGFQKKSRAIPSRQALNLFAIYRLVF